MMKSGSYKVSDRFICTAQKMPQPAVMSSSTQKNLRGGGSGVLSGGQVLLAKARLPATCFCGRQ